MSNQYDIVVIGGGMVGLALTVALAQVGFSVAVVEAQAPPLHWQNTDYNTRVSAIHLGAYAFLKDLNVWGAIRSSSYSPLERMVVWDAQGGGRITFNASDIGKDALGYIVENRDMIRVLWKRCQNDNNVTLLSGITPESMDDHHITLEDGSLLEASLVVGADGAYSWLRQHMAIECGEKPYHHDALVAVIETEKPHFCTAYQPFLTTGPLGVLPLSNAHCVSIVWSADPVRVDSLLSMSLDDFDQELINALEAALGNMHCLSERKRIPLVQRHAKHYVQGNKVLVGDAAHTIHPLAGQGANLGFMDVACLVNVLATAKNSKNSVNDSKLLRRYERWRKSENEFMLLSMSLFKSSFTSGSPLTANVRSWGLNVIDQFHILKRYVMRCAVHEDFP